MVTTTSTTTDATTRTRHATTGTSTSPSTRRRVGHFILEVLGELGRQPSLLDPWMLMAPHYPSAGTRYRQ